MENAEKRGLVFEHAIPTGAKKKNQRKRNLLEFPLLP